MCHKYSFINFLDYNENHGFDFTHPAGPSRAAVVLLHVRHGHRGHLLPAGVLVRRLARNRPAKDRRTPQCLRPMHRPREVLPLRVLSKGKLMYVYSIVKNSTRLRACHFLFSSVVPSTPNNLTVALADSHNANRIKQEIMFTYSNIWASLLTCYTRCPVLGWA